MAIIDVLKKALHFRTDLESFLNYVLFLLKEKCTSVLAMNLEVNILGQSIVLLEAI